MGAASSRRHVKARISLASLYPADELSVFASDGSCFAVAISYSGSTPAAMSAKSQSYQLIGTLARLGEWRNVNEALEIGYLSVGVGYLVAVRLTNITSSPLIKQIEMTDLLWIRNQDIVLDTRLQGQTAS